MSDFGLKQTKSMLWNEASLSSECKICDNIDLDTIYLDFCSYYHLRFGKLPKIVKRIECESNDSTISKGKVNKIRSTENTMKMADDSKKKIKQEPAELSSDNFFITNSSESHNDDRKSETNSVKYRKSLDLFGHFSGEMRDFAYMIERLVR